ncbi:radical SAM protein [Microbulbifer sp. Q7]|uniref:radical SAM protein n=1 Tax=Microbulbifer sp. Q7 TaxID=1785091 RepID=UPI0008362A48|nr:radical SAM protein [Microbulbifer sp. Q7]
MKPVPVERHPAAEGATRGLCNVCYGEVDAEVTVREDGVYLLKACPEHGRQDIRIETDADFYQRSLVTGPGRDYWYSVIGTTALEVTERCNVSCPSCYALPENGAQDPEIDELVQIAKQSTAEKSKTLILMGSEPTMRRDLPELIQTLQRETGKPVSMYTNGIRLASEKYCDEVLPHLYSVAFSLHMRDYLPQPVLFEKKLKALQNVIARKVPINHISFSLRDLDDLDEVWEHCGQFWGVPHHFRIRTPSQVGRCDDEPFYLSDLVKAFVRKANVEGKKVVWYPADNNPYHVMVRVEQQFFRLIHFPGVEEANLNHLQSPPYALFMPELGETNLVHQFIMQEKDKKARTPMRAVERSAAPEVRTGVELIDTVAV